MKIGLSARGSSLISEIDIGLRVERCIFLCSFIFFWLSSLLVAPLPLLYPDWFEIKILEPLSIYITYYACTLILWYHILYASASLNGWMVFGDRALLFSAQIGNSILLRNLYRFTLSECSATKASLCHQRRLMGLSAGALGMIQDKMITHKKFGLSCILLLLSEGFSLLAFRCWVHGPTLVAWCILSCSSCGYLSSYYAHLSLMPHAVVLIVA